MIVAGVILIALYLLLPALEVAVSVALLHAMLVLGVILLGVGLVLYLGARAGHPWGRRYY